jgi:hypothetical protein
MESGLSLFRPPFPTVLVFFIFLFERRPSHVVGGFFAAGNVAPIIGVFVFVLYTIACFLVNILSMGG